MPEVRGERDVAPGKRALGQHRLRDRSDLLRILLGIEVVAEHHRASLDRLREQPVIVELRPHLLVEVLEAGDLLQLLLRQLVEGADAGRVVGFREHHVEAHDRELVLVEQLVHEPRHDVARPGPARHLLQALLVDVEDDNAAVDGARHGHVEPRVVDDVVQLGDDADAVEPGRVPDEEQRDREADRDPYDVLFQIRPAAVKG